MTKKLTIAMAGGGSGGHAYPIKSMIEFLAGEKDLGNCVESVVWFGQKGKIEEKEFVSLGVNGQFKCQFVSILSGKIRRQKNLKAWIQNVRDMFFVIWGFFEAVYWIKKHKVDVIFCKGGYVTVPVVLAGALLRKKIVAHESDTHPGLASRIALPFAKWVFTGFDNVFPRAEIVGQILSDQIVFDPKNSVDVSEKDKFFTQIGGIPLDKTIILVLGGSLGSKSLYEGLKKTLQKHPKRSKKFHFVVVGGFINTDVEKLFLDVFCVTTIGYLSQKQMGMLCYYADVGLTRGGTTSLAEQTLYGMKLIIVPIPWTHDQHDNAEYYVKNYGAVSVDQCEDLVKNLEKNIDDCVGFKKKHLEKNIANDIAKTKSSIRKKLLE